MTLSTSLQTELSLEPIKMVAAVQSILYAQGDFAIVRLDNPQHPTVAVGAIAHVQVGEMLQWVGQWEQHSQYGKRLRIQAAYPWFPQSIRGIERYLGTLTGVGPALARRIVEEFGDQALLVLENEAWRIAQMKGFGQRRAKKASEEIRERKAQQQIMVFLQGYGISPAYATRIFKTYKHQTIEKLQSNPYLLARDVAGIGFALADQIAAQLGIARDAPLRIEAALLHTLQQAADQGHCFLLQETLHAHALNLLQQDQSIQIHTSHLMEAEGTLLSQRLLINEQMRVYLRPLHDAERILAQKLRRLIQASPAPSHTISHQGEVTLSAQQQQALEMVCQKGVCIITGGPGTGKTTLIQALVQTFAQQRVLLLAPTGRAAKRLSEVTGRPARTIHRALEWNPSQSWQRSQASLAADLIVCDEASMMDLPLACLLIQAITAGTKLVLVGDVDQLPSVGPGRVLADLIDSKQLPVIRLNTIFRQAAHSGIVRNAHHILQGEMLEFAEQESSKADFFLINADAPLKAREVIVKLCTQRIPQRFGLDPLRDIQVLTPMHRGDLGTQSLNQVLQAALNPTDKTGLSKFLPKDKVMQISNDYDRDVWNGDIGIIHSVENGVVTVNFDDKMVSYQNQQLNQLELAYAVSIHKSQGSEYPAVVIPLTLQHYLLLQRNLLYTAVTRGKQLVVLVGSQRALSQAIRTQSESERFTSLAMRLQET